jgi:predicted GNAT family acetyltransferase
MSDDQGNGGAQASAAASDSVTVDREDGPNKGRYRVVIDNAEAEMTYSRVGPRLIIIDHTFVPDAMRGRSVGVRMVQRAVEDARREGVSILPLCPFAKAQIQRHPEWQDVLQQSRTAGR